MTITDTEVVLDLEITGDRGSAQVAVLAFFAGLGDRARGHYRAAAQRAGEDAGDPIHMWPVSYLVEHVNDTLDWDGPDGPGITHTGGEDAYVESVRVITRGGQYAGRDSEWTPADLATLVAAHPWTDTRPGAPLVGQLTIDGAVVGAR